LGPLGIFFFFMIRSKEDWVFKRLGSLIWCSWESGVGVFLFQRWLRYKVFVAKYRVETGHIRGVVQRHLCGVNIYAVCKRVLGEFEGGWFEKGVVLRVSNGESYFFWNHPWLEGGFLRSRCNILFDIYLDKNTAVAEMSS